MTLSVSAIDGGTVVLYFTWASRLVSVAILLPLALIGLLDFAGYAVFRTLGWHRKRVHAAPMQTTAPSYGPEGVVGLTDDESGPESPVTRKVKLPNLKFTPVEEPSWVGVEHEDQSQAAAAADLKP